MNKQELFDKIITKTTIKKEDLEKLWNEVVEEVKHRGVPEADIEKYAVNRLHAYVKRELSSPAVKLEGYVLGLTDITDYGAQRMYDEAKALYEANPQQAINEGVVDAEGNPIYTKPEWRKGQIIKPEESKGRTAILLAKREGEENFKKAFLKLAGDKINLEIPLFTPVIFRANMSQKSTDDLLLLNSSTVTEFQATGEMLDDLTPIISDLKRCFGENMVTPSELKEWHLKNQDDINRVAIIKATISDLRFTRDDVRSNILELDDINMGLDPDDIERITCWVPKEFKINFKVGTPDVIIVGRTGMDENENINVNAYGIWCPKIWRNGDHEPEPINGDNQVEVEQPKEESEDW